MGAVCITVAFGEYFEARGESLDEALGKLREEVREFIEGLSEGERAVLGVSDADVVQVSALCTPTN